MARSRGSGELFAASPNGARAPRQHLMSALSASCATPWGHLAKLTCLNASRETSVDANYAPPCNLDHRSCQQLPLCNDQLGLSACLCVC